MADAHPNLLLPETQHQGRVNFPVRPRGGLRPKKIALGPPLLSACSFVGKNLANSLLICGALETAFLSFCIHGAGRIRNALTQFRGPWRNQPNGAECAVIPRLFPRGAGEPPPRSNTWFHRTRFWW